MPLTSAIQDYDPAWPQAFADEAQRLRPILAERLIAQHHVGSTAVPGLAAKPEIDILAEIHPPGLPEPWTPMFAALGYRRGGDLSLGHHFFKRDVDGVRTHKVHICQADHPATADMLKFRDHLRRHPADRAAYQALKRRLEQENTAGIGQYLAAKAPFIDEVIARIGRES